MRPYNEQSRLTTKLQYFTRNCFPIFCFGGATPESPTRGDIQTFSLPPLDPADEICWGGISPTPTLGYFVLAGLKQTCKSRR
jgi:hypothetical protein